MPEFDKGVMVPDLNAMPGDQELSMQPDANINKVYTGSKRSYYHIIISDDDDDDDDDDDVVFLGETLPSESGPHCPSKRQRVEAHPTPQDNDNVAVLGSGVVEVDDHPIEESDEQHANSDEVDATTDTAAAPPPMETRNKRDVSLVERFTEEEIEMHINSLHEGSVDLNDIETCQLCGESQLVFPAPPLYCSLCSVLIGDESLYYIPGESTSGATQHQICRPCYDRCRRKTLPLSGVHIVKANMIQLNNANNLVTEDWVACDSCGKWQHQICGLYNRDKDADKTSDYICPRCLLEERRSNNGNMGCDDNTDLGAEDLPETILSDFIERKLKRRLKEERQKTAEATGKSIDEVSLPNDLTLRVVFSADKSSHVSKTFADFLRSEHYPSEFPYRSKVILLFQKVDGVDVCIFAMIVQEFGSECSQPNRRSAYIGYLDSVKYFRPERVTFSGEALRTFVFHEILIGYLEYCKFRGFTTAYIWSCPPQKGQDYIMYSHPKTQRTPNTKKLREWYNSMLDKAKERRVVTDVTNLYDRFFSSSCNITAAQLPYFEGSFWSYHAELLSQKLESESKNVKSLSRRVLKGSTSKDAGDAKNILLMEKLGKLISNQKEDLIVVDLNYTCTRCSELILSGSRWFCKKCKNLQLCERCHDQEEELPGEHTHTMNGEEKHSMSNVIMNIPSTTEDNDVILGGDNTFQTREMFLSFSQKRNYCFDTLRRAKNSSMMILHHLHIANKLHNSQNPSGGGLLQVVTCMACQKDVSRTIYYASLCCLSYRACTSCFNKKVLRLLHLFPVVPAIYGILPRTVVAFGLLQALLHAHACRLTASNDSCSFPRCSVVKKLFIHLDLCEKQRGDCRTCIEFAVVISIHAYHCQDPNCSIPHCSDMKEKFSVRGLR